MKRWKILSIVLALLVLSLILVVRSTRPGWTGVIAFRGFQARDDRGLYLSQPDFLLRPRLTRLTPEGVSVGLFAWSPDGTRLAFRCEIESSEAGICLIDRNGDNMSFLLSEKELGDFTGFFAPLDWSPDGNFLVVVGDTRSDSRRYYLHLVNVNTGEVTGLNTRSEPPDSIRAISLSPDGMKLAIQFYSYEIHLLDMETLELEYLTVGSDPVWSPSGDHLAFSGVVPLYTIASDGSDLRVLFRQNGICVSPHGLSWSPNGRYIAFITSCGENDPAYPYLYDVETGNALRLFKRRKNDPLLDYPNWAPDPGDQFDHSVGN